MADQGQPVTCTRCKASGAVVHTARLGDGESVDFYAWRETPAGQTRAITPRRQQLAPVCGVCRRPVLVVVWSHGVTQ
jgi:hypothetical protein